LRVHTFKEKGSALLKDMHAKGYAKDQKQLELLIEKSKQETDATVKKEIETVKQRIAG
jgi:hypothetical protein